VQSLNFGLMEAALPEMSLIRKAEAAISDQRLGREITGAEARWSGGLLEQPGGSALHEETQRRRRIRRRRDIYAERLRLRDSKSDGVNRTYRSSQQSGRGKADVAIVSKRQIDAR
jgi:hypothetical protein